MRAKRGEVLKSRLDILRGVVADLKVSHHHYFPPLRHVAAFPEFLEIIRSPSDVEESFYALRDRLPDVVAAWETEQKSKLLEYVKDAMGLPDDIDPLELAVRHYFTCQCPECPNVPADGKI